MERARLPDRRRGGVRALHAEGRDEERGTPPAEPLLVDLLSRPQAEGLATLVLIDEVLMFARGKVAVDAAWRGRLVEVSWFLDENEFGSGAATDGTPPPLPRAWRLGNRPNLKQLHHDACANRVTAEAVEVKLLAEVRATKGTRAFGARVHMLPERPRDAEDDGESIDKLLRAVSPDPGLKR